MGAVPGPDKKSRSRGVCTGKISFSGTNPKKLFKKKLLSVAYTRPTMSVGVSVRLFLSQLTYLQESPRVVPGVEGRPEKREIVLRVPQGMGPREVPHGAFGFRTR